MSEKDIQALHAGISRRDWHATEVAANAIRDGAASPLGAALETIEVLRRSEAAVAARYIASQAELERLRTSGREFMEAAEAVFDWMNGNDLSADHEEQHPEDFARVSKALVAFRAALSGSNE